MKRSLFIWFLLYSFFSSVVNAFCFSSLNGKKFIGEIEKTLYKDSSNRSSSRLKKSLRSYSALSIHDVQEDRKGTLLEVSKQVQNRVRTFQNVEKCIEKAPYIAVIRDIHNLEDITSCIDDLYSTGYKLVSIAVDTFETTGHSKSRVPAIDWNLFNIIQERYQDHYDLHIGISTCLNIEQAKNAQKAGAAFITTPHTDRFMIHQCLSELNLFILPGGATPTDILNSYNSGIRYMKLFPSSIVSPEYVKSIRAIIPSDMKLIISGGISPHNIPLYSQVGVDGFIFGRALVSTPYNQKDLRENAYQIWKAIQESTETS